MLDNIAIVLAIGSLLLWGPLLLVWQLWVLWNLIDIAKLVLRELNERTITC